MLRLAVLLCTSLLAAPRAGAPGPATDELDRRLAELADADALRRQQAELWLAGHVQLDHYGRLAREARAGDAEVRLRLGRVVGAAAPDLSLAALFLAEPEPELATVGERAIRGRAARWSQGLRMPGVTARLLDDALRRRAQTVWPATLRLPIDGTLSEAVERLARHADLPVGLAVDPALRERSAFERHGPELVGTWNELVPALADAFGVGVDGHGFDPLDLGSTRPAFVRFGHLRETGRTNESRPPSTELLLAWFRQVLLHREGDVRVAAARALAGSGWPDALAWLEARFLEGDDGPGLEGLLAAAAAGRVAPTLRRPAVLRGLLARAEEDLAVGSDASLARAHRIADALRQLDALSSGGEPLAPVLLEGWEGLSDRALWLRLVALEALRAGAGAERVLALLQDPMTAPGLRRQALRTRAASHARLPGDQATPAPLQGARPLLENVAGPRDAADLARLLVAAGLTPAPAWRDPATTPIAGFAPRCAVLGWFLARDGSGEAGAHLADLLDRTEGEPRARGERIAAALTPWLERGEVDRLQRAWQAARGASRGTRALELDRVALLLGLLPPERAEAVWRELSAAPLGPGEDLAALGVVAGGLGREAALGRQRLAFLLGQALGQDVDPDAAEGLVRAVERTYLELAGRGLDPGADAWSREVQRSLARARRARLAQELHRRWPPAPEVSRVDLAVADRRLGADLR